MPRNHPTDDRSITSSNLATTHSQWKLPRSERDGVGPNCVSRRLTDAKPAACLSTRARNLLDLSIHDLTVSTQVSDRMCLVSHGQVGLPGKVNAVLIPSNLKRIFGASVEVVAHLAPPVTYVLPLLCSSKPDAR